uniref:Uncharacterized protein n=1 Tax=Lepeophtheirus salmonis TaxID=72036 RepID=A0A0K2U838_LEPSM
MRVCSELVAPTLVELRIKIGS